MPALLDADIQRINSTFPYKKQPKGKQKEVIEGTWHKPVWALLCRPGTGKTKMSLDTAARQYHAGMITAMIVIAPNGVHRQWVEEGIPTHLPDCTPVRSGFYNSSMGKKAFDALVKNLRCKEDVLRVLTISFDGLQTVRGKNLARGLATGHRTLLVVDESHFAANQKGATHKAVLALSALCTTKRISTGTLVRQNPFAIFGQFQLLGHGLLGTSSFPAFKSLYAEMLPPSHGLVRRIADDFKEKTGKKIVPQIQAKGLDDRPIYKNLMHLRRMLERYSSFLTLEDTQGAEPEVRVTTRLVTLTDEQQRIYNDLDDFGVAIHNESLLTATMEMAARIRLCQIAGGFFPSDDNDEAVPIPGGNPKLESLLEYIEEIGPDTPVVIWCKFTPEVVAVCEALREKYGPDSAVRYDGTVSSADRAVAKQNFVTGVSRYFVGQIKAGGTGLDGLQTKCNYMAFYSNDDSYGDRVQAISRLARTGGNDVVLVVDIVAEGTKDEEIARCMQSAQDVHYRVLSTKGNLAVSVQNTTQLAQLGVL
jgi:SNF2 family DNA or RNA helicase